MRLAGGGGGGSLLEPVGFGLGKSGTLALDLAFAIAFGLSLTGGVETGSDFCTLAGGSAARAGLAAGAFGPGIAFGAAGAAFGPTGIAFGGVAYLSLGAGMAFGTAGVGMAFGTGGALEMSGATVGGMIAACGCGTFGPTGGGGISGTDCALCAG